MDARERREQLLQLLQMDIKPMSASKLAERFEVSRQVIVGDIALLRAGGVDIIATARGYILNKTDAAAMTPDDAADSYVLACRHDKSDLEAELYTIVDNGGSILNVSSFLISLWKSRLKASQKPPRSFTLLEAG